MILSIGILDQCTNLSLVSSLLILDQPCSIRLLLQKMCCLVSRVNTFEMHKRTRVGREAPTGQWTGGVHEAAHESLVFICEGAVKLAKSIVNG